MLFGELQRENIRKLLELLFIFGGHAVLFFSFSATIATTSGRWHVWKEPLSTTRAANCKRFLESLCEILFDLI
jgi:hypothetical protein